MNRGRQQAAAVWKSNNGCLGLMSQRRGSMTALRAVLLFRGLRSACLTLTSNSTWGVRQSAMAARFSGVSDAKTAMPSRMASCCTRFCTVAATTMARNVPLSSAHKHARRRRLQGVGSQTFCAVMDDTLLPTCARHVSFVKHTSVSTPTSTVTFDCNLNRCLAWPSPKL